MSADSKLLRLADDGDIVEATFAVDTIIDEACIQEIGRELQAAVVERQSPRCLVNFLGVQHLSSAALGMLIDLNTTIQEREGRLALAEIEGTIFDVFKITKLDRVFSIHGTAAEARAELR
jgi:anti-sigma B factor antagonist